MTLMLDHFLNTLGLKAIQDLIDPEINTMVFKVLNGLAPEYLSDSFIRNSESHLRSPRNTKTDLDVPKKKQTMGRNSFPIKVQSHGMPFHLKLSRHLSYWLLKQN